jgi:signal transduction histidine kinase
VIDELAARCRRSGYTAPHSGRGAASPNRNDNSTKRRPAVTSRLAERIRLLEQRRQQAVDASGSQLRRLERDLHDGAQARIVALAMELGQAREELEHSDAPRRAAVRVAAAHEEAKRALVELRDLARGIYPAVLTDWAWRVPSRC